MYTMQNSLLAILGKIDSRPVCAESYHGILSEAQEALCCDARDCAYKLVGSKQVCALAQTHPELEEQIFSYKSCKAN